MGVGRAMEDTNRLIVDVGIGKKGFFCNPFRLNKSKEVEKIGPMDWLGKGSIFDEK